MTNSESSVIARSAATKQSIPALRPDGLLRGVYHRARIRATRWLAMTEYNNQEKLRESSPYVHHHARAETDRSLRLAPRGIAGPSQAHRPVRRPPNLRGRPRPAPNLRWGPADRQRAGAARIVPSARPY